MKLRIQFVHSGLSKKRNYKSKFEFRFDLNGVYCLKYHTILIENIDPIKERMCRSGGSRKIIWKNGNRNLKSSATVFISSSNFLFIAENASPVMRKGKIL